MHDFLIIAVFNLVFFKTCAQDRKPLGLSEWISSKGIARVKKRGIDELFY
jgi:hypothetical protein